MERLLKRLALLHTAIALVITLSMATALLAVRTATERSAGISVVEAHIELLEQIRRDARELGRSGRRYLLTGDQKEHQRVLAIEDALNKRRAELRKYWPHVDTDVDTYVFSVVRSMSQERSDVIPALVQYENEVLVNGNRMASTIDDQIAREHALKEAVHSQPRLAQVSQWFLVIASLLALGALMGSVKTMVRAVQKRRTDDTADEVARAELEHARRDLVAAATALRNPLQRIVDDVRFLGQSPRHEPEREVLEGIARNAMRVETKLCELFDKTAFEIGTVSLNRESCNIAVLVNEVVKAERTTAAGRGVRLRFDAPLGLSMFADRVRIASVLSSLLKMQVESADDAALITVDTVDTGDGVQFTIASDVVSFAETTTFRQPFPAHGDPRLLSAQRVIQAHSGELDLEPTLTGLTIRFTIPRGVRAAVC